MEDQFSTMPAGEPREPGGEKREKNSVWQHGVGCRETQCPVKAGNRDERHRGNAMRPACDTAANAGHQKQLRRADEPRGYAGGKGGTGGPEADAQPEGIAAPPVEYIRAERRNNEGDGKMHTHRMKRMAGHSDGRTNVFFLNSRLDGIFRMAGFAHVISPIRKITLSGSGPFRRLVAICASATLFGCSDNLSGDLSVLDPAGPAAREIATLWWVMLTGSVLLFLLVMGLFAAVMLKPGFGSRFPAKTWIMTGGFLMPVPVLAVLLVFAFAMGERHLPWRGDHNPVRIEARAYMWYWEFHYLDYPDTEPTIGVMHMPARYDVDIVATSDNVIHGFWVPRLGGKVDAIPGHDTTVRLYADRPGSYGGICAEYCGTGHAAMTFRVKAHTPEAFFAAIGEAP